MGDPERRGVGGDGHVRIIALLAPRSGPILAAVEGSVRGHAEEMSYA
jgi:hypothetical protein